MATRSSWRSSRAAEPTPACQPRSATFLPLGLRPSPADARAVVLAAAAIGREASHELIAQVAALPQDATVGSACARPSTTTCWSGRSPRSCGLRVPPRADPGAVPTRSCCRRSGSPSTGRSCGRSRRPVARRGDRSTRRSSVTICRPLSPSPLMPPIKRSRRSHSRSPWLTSSGPSNSGARSAGRNRLRDAIRPPPCCSPHDAPRRSACGTEPPISVERRWPSWIRSNGGTSGSSCSSSLPDGSLPTTTKSLRAAAIREAAELVSTRSPTALLARVLTSSPTWQTTTAGSTRHGASRRKPSRCHEPSAARAEEARALIGWQKSSPAASCSRRRQNECWRRRNGSPLMSTRLRGFRQPPRASDRRTSRR